MTSTEQKEAGQNSTRTIPATGFIIWSTVGIVFAAMIFHVVREHYVKSYSDPLNWLGYAMNFVAEFGQSRWPYGYPLFLAGMLKLVGPFYIYWINLPVIMAMYLLVMALTRLMMRTFDEEAGSDSFAGLYAFLIIASFDPARLTYYVNPYRDFLSYVYVLAALYCLITAAGRPGKLLRLIPAGALLGFACGVREPSILMLAPMALYGLWIWYQRRPELPLLKSILLFAAGLFVGLLPLLAQSYLSTRQVVLPPQAFKDGNLVPGMNRPSLDLVMEVSAKALRHAVFDGGWVVFLGIIGCLMAFRKGRHALWIIFGISAGIYFVFYLFYWTFMQRYFYPAFLFLSVPAGTALYFAGKCLASHVRSGNGSRWVQPIMAMALAGVVGFRIAAQDQGDEQFQINNARKFAGDVSSIVGTSSNTYVFARRHLCELLEYFTAGKSGSADVGRESGRDSFDLFYQNWASGMENHQQVFAVDLGQEDSRLSDNDPLRNLFNLEPCGTLISSNYNLAPVLGVERMQFYRVLPWSNRVVHTEIARAGEFAVLEVDAGLPMVVDPDRRSITLDIDGQIMPTRNWNKAEYFDVSSFSSRDSWRLSLQSDDALPSEPSYRFYKMDEPIELNFSWQAAAPALGRLKGDFIQPAYGMNSPRIISDVQMELPEPVLESGRWTMELLVSSGGPRRKGAKNTMEILIDDTSLGVVDVPQDLKNHPFVIHLPENMSRPRLIMRREVRPDDLTLEHCRSFFWYPLVDGILLVEARLWRKPEVISVDQAIGVADDARWISAGWHPREAQGRWTTSKAELRLDVKPTGEDMLLELEIDSASRHPDAPSADPKFYFNGTLLSRIVRAADDAVRSANTWLFKVPASMVQNTNLIVIECTPWVAKQTFKTRDDRSLGLLVRHVKFHPEPTD